MKDFKKGIYWQCDLMAVNKSNVACVHILANMTQVSNVAPEPLVLIPTMTGQDNYLVPC
jgi:hypothetical protein